MPASDEDAVPTTPAEPVTRPGDLILLGPHRLLCGDATRAEHVAWLFSDVRSHLMVTDPPYGVEYDPSWRNAAGVSATRRTGRVANDDRADWRAAWALFPGEVAYVWHAAIHATTVAESLIACGFDLRAQIVWSKSRFALGRGDYHWQTELADRRAHAIHGLIVFARIAGIRNEPLKRPMFYGQHFACMRPCQEKSC